MIAVLLDVLDSEGGLQVSRSFRCLRVLQLIVGMYTTSVKLAANVWEKVNQHIDASGRAVLGMTLSGITKLVN